MIHFIPPIDWWVIGDAPRDPRGDEEAGMRGRMKRGMNYGSAAGRDVRVLWEGWGKLSGGGPNKLQNWHLGGREHPYQNQLEEPLKEKTRSASLRENTPQKIVTSENQLQCHVTSRGSFTLHLR
ncbi:hypothetical protein CDAR_215831 [Caerostris darwini]|uniref:Uncharacterized protein n=1 Tax=Caerostris darwini TaxID=1538125 RepID=A0AAV4NPK9_9ARAC|nr:hypothetical protein CDAR_215831 [Caerostris darwini]